MPGRISLEILIRNLAPPLLEQLDNHYGVNTKPRKKVRFALVLFERGDKKPAVCISDAYDDELLHALAAIAHETKQNMEK